MEIEGEAEAIRDEATSVRAAEADIESEQHKILVLRCGNTSASKPMTADGHDNSAALSVAFVSQKSLQKMAIRVISTVI